MNATEIQAIIDLLIKVIPLAINEGMTIYPEIKAAITALTTSGGATADQVLATNALDKQLDDAFDAAAAQSLLEP